MKKSFGSVNRLFSGITLLISIILSNSCSKSSTDYSPNPGPGNKGGPGANEVWIQNMAFNPATITVNTGTTITWTNKDGVTHTVTSDNDLFSSGSIAGNAYIHTFSTAGSYAYHCSIHTYMTATVIVKDVINPGY
jgi:plastocyanin